MWPKLRTWGGCFNIRVRSLRRYVVRRGSTLRLRQIKDICLLARPARYHRQCVVRDALICFRFYLWSAGTCTLKHARTLTHTHVHTHARVYTHAFTHTRTHTHTWAHLHTHKHAPPHNPIVFTHTHIHTYTRTHTPSHTRTLPPPDTLSRSLTHTHTHSRFSSRDYTLAV